MVRPGGEWGKWFGCFVLRLGGMWLFHLDCVISELPSNLSCHVTYLPCVSMWGHLISTLSTIICSTCHPCSGDTCHLWPLKIFIFSLVWLELWSSITFVYELYLRQFLCHWKSIFEIYAIMLFSREFETMKFWDFMDPRRNFLDPPGSTKVNKYLLVIDIY